MMTKVTRNPLFFLLFLVFTVLPLVPVGEVFASEAHVFVYHRFNDSRYPSTNITAEKFKAHLQVLQDEQFTVLTLGEVVARMRAGESLPQRCAVISVDDGYRSFLTDGWPLLKQYAYPATLFVSTDAVGGDDYMTWQDLRLLQQEGVEIGNHSASHAYLLDRLPAETESAWRGRVADDLKHSQAMFEKALGSSPELFAYPYGEFSTELSRLVRAAGFAAAFGQQSGVITNSQDLYMLPRFPVGGPFSALSEFRNRVFMKSLPVKISGQQDTVIIGENPPLLKLHLNRDLIDERTLKCYVPGQAECSIQGGAEEGGVYSVRALQPLTGRRSKYTVTASDAPGKVWYWYSHLWVIPSGLGEIDQPVSR